MRNSLYLLLKWIKKITALLESYNLLTNIILVLVIIVNIFLIDILPCRSRLEAFEQTCSVDQTTSRCAGPPSMCRESILGILGTMLRTNCACKDTSPSKFYDCMGWQRVFWFNSCVGTYTHV